MLFAEITSAQVGDFLAIGFYLIGGLTSCVGLWVMLRKPAATETALTNQPITVRAEAEFASKDEHEGLRAEFADFRDEIRAAFDEAGHTSRQSREKIYNELRRLAELMSSNTTKTELTHHRVETLDAKIDRLRDRQ
jgi:hypothetical protein